MSDLQQADDQQDPRPHAIRPSGPRRLLVDQGGAELEVSLVRTEGRDFLYPGRLLPRV